MASIMAPNFTFGGRDGPSSNQRWQSACFCDKYNKIISGPLPLSKLKGKHTHTHAYTCVCVCVCVCVCGGGGGGGGDVVSQAHCVIKFAAVTASLSWIKDLKDMHTVKFCYNAV